MPAGIKETAQFVVPDQRAFPPGTSPDSSMRRVA